jgi:phosphonate transport system substrate-binding protein
MAGKRLFITLILLVMGVTILGGCQRAKELKQTKTKAEEIKVLRVSAIPDEDPDELNRIYQPIVKYLKKQLGIEVKFVPVVDYAATVEGLVAKKLDLVWYGGLTHVQARKKTNGKAYAIVMRQEDAKFHSKFITRTDSGINTLSDLKGKTFAFGSVSSTSGHLMPRYFLLKHGLDPDKDFKKYSYSGAHDATAAWVQAGKVDAGALNEAVWQKLVETGKIDPKKVKVFWTTPAYVDYNWTVRGDLPKDLVEKIKQAFLQLDYDDPEDRKILDLHSTKGYIPASEDKWQEIEEAAKAAGLLE